MPPKAKITREMILDASFEIVQEQGIDALTARTIAAKLSCSTQPIMYLFATIEELKRALYEKVDWYHSEYLMSIQNPEEIMLGIGINYIHFAVSKPHLFRFLFQSGYATENNLLEMVDSEELVPVINAMQEVMQLSLEQTKRVFVSIAIFAHGYASILVNNSLEYDEAVVISHLEHSYLGAILAVQNEENTSSTPE